jgi:hypothetical protein
VTATPAERTALLFLATIGVLGVGARALSSSDRMERDRPRGPDVAALDAQLAAVDSAIADERRPGARASGGNGRRSRTTRARPERSPRPRACAPRRVSARGAGMERAPRPTRDRWTSTSLTRLRWRRFLASDRPWLNASWPSV